MPRKETPTIVYKYRGAIERGTKRGYVWHDGYSADSPEGFPLYPWMTRKECFHDAKVQGKKARFEGR